MLPVDITLVVEDIGCCKVGSGEVSMLERMVGGFGVVY